MRIPPGGMAGLPLIAAAAFFMQALDATILNTALPAIAESLGESPLAMQMTVVGYTLTVALLIPASGWFADRFGTRNVFLFAVALFALGSLSCALSGSLRMLVLSRVIQGIGGAMMMPVARLAVLRAFPREKLVAVLNFISIPGLVGPVVGPLLGGALVTYVGWHWIFLINIPVGLAGMLYAWRIMPQFTGTHGPFDFTGFAFFGLGLAFFSGGLELFGSRAESKSLAPFLLLAGVALLALYAWHARRSKAPLIRLGVFRIHTFRVGIAVVLAVVFYTVLAVQGTFPLSYLPIYIAAAYLVWMLLLLGREEQRVLRYLKSDESLLGTEYVLRFDAGKLSVEIPEKKLRNTVALAKLASAIEISSVFMLCLSADQLYLVPTAAMTDEQRTALRGLLSSRLGERFYSSILAREKKK